MRLEKDYFKNGKKRKTQKEKTKHANSDNVNLNGLIVHTVKRIKKKIGKMEHKRETPKRNANGTYMGTQIDDTT